MYEILFALLFLNSGVKTTLLCCFNSGAAPDSHPDITISHDEVIDIFAFSSASRLNFNLYYSAKFMESYFTTYKK